MMMNIAIFLEQHFEPDAGGVQRSTSKLAEIFKDYGHGVIIISTSSKSQQITSWHNIPVFYIDIENDTLVLKQVIERENISILINQAGYSYRFTKYLKINLNEKINIINTLRINPLNFYDNYKEFVGAFLSQRRLSFLNNIFIQNLLLRFHIIKQRHELNYIIKNTSAFVMLSERFKSELYFLTPNLKKYSSKIHGISNPFERPDIDVSTLEKENVILFVGRVNILQKRVDLLMQIWEKLHKRLPDWDFWVVGEGEDKAFMENYCKENNLDRVIFFGQDNPNEYYKKAKIFHMTSAYEGFGNVLVEAQSYGGVPVLFNSYSAAEDIVTHNVDGILVKPFDVEEYVNQNLELINDPPKLKQMSNNAFENMTKFSYNETYKKWNGVFQSIAK